MRGLDPFTTAVSLTARASSQPMVTIYRLMSRDIFLKEREKSPG
ncbi:hypothetical protein BER2_1304 [plant metagenome]|uniref:Uncharacterized protein n=1 Tax=plant metagenome TaxID=1297885 RepID=A0A484QU97_9ZZZZ